MKTCSNPTCLLLLHLTEFYKHKGRKDGLDTFCKPCRRAANAISRNQYKDTWNETRRTKWNTNTHSKDVRNVWRRNNKDSINEKLRNNSHRQEWRKDYKLKNKEHISEVEAKRYAQLIPIIPIEKECVQCHRTKPAKEFSPTIQHTDGLKSYCKDCHSKNTVIFHRTHPEIMSAILARRSARIRGANCLDRITHIGLATRDNWKCHLCHKTVTRKNWSIDHLIPVSQGGEHIWGNVALAHVRCNVRRGAGRTIAQLRLFG